MPPMPTPQQLYAELYDTAVPDWPGEIDFYRDLIGAHGGANLDALEIACGTGRVALRLAPYAGSLTGLDLSPELLAIARQKSQAIANVDWAQADMRAFALGRVFGLALIPGHSFQFMLTPEDQLACLENIGRHLSNDGMLVVHLDHQDVGWLAGLLRNKDTPEETIRELTHPITGGRFRTRHTWAFEPATQTATVTRRWEGLDAGGAIIARWEMAPAGLHCVFRFEMEHLLCRAGFAIEAVYGDFFRADLGSASESMIWLARKAASGAAGSPGK